MGLKSSTLSSADFLDYESTIENLFITESKLSKISNHAFKHVRAIKFLDLSENDITTIDKDAFTDIGHSIEKLSFSNALSPQMKSLPTDALKPLVCLLHLDLSNNKLKTVADNAFHFQKNIITLELHDNEIDQIRKGTFQGEIHTNLQVISLSFNHLQSISSSTFTDLEVCNFK